MVRPLVLVRCGIDTERDSENVSKDERSDGNNEGEGDSVPYQFMDFSFILKRLTEVTTHKAAYPDEVAFPHRIVQTVSFPEFLDLRQRAAIPELLF